MSKEIVLEVRDDISEKNTIFHMFNYLTLASGALFPVLQSLLITSPWNCVTDVIYNFYHVFPNAYNIKMYRYIDRK